MRKRTVVFDLESDGLLYDAKRVWCCATFDIANQVPLFFGPSEIEKAIAYLQDSYKIIGHNICGFDIPLIEKLYGITLPLKNARDTYVMSKLFFPDRESHSLASYGRQLGVAKPEHEDWSHFSEEMAIRCKEDVKINVKTYEYLLFSKEFSGCEWISAVLLEQEMHYWQALQEMAGVDVDKELAEKLVVQLDETVEEICKELRPRLPKKICRLGESVNKPFKKDGTYIKRVEEWFDESDGARQET